MIKQTDDICASFERRLCEISPAFATSVATNGGGANGSASRTLVVRHPAPSSRGGKNGAGGVAMPVNGAAVQSCAIAQAASGSLLAQAAAEAGLPPNAPLSAAAAEALLRGHLKKRHAACILSLREEFQRKRKKGKLPGDATSALKAFWTLHIDWPYPGEEDKAELADKTGLNATQINNWFSAWLITYTCVRCRALHCWGHSARCDGASVGRFIGFHAPRPAVDSQPAEAALAQAVRRLAARQPGGVAQGTSVFSIPLRIKILTPTSFFCTEHHRQVRRFEGRDGRHGALKRC